MTTPAAWEAALDEMTKSQKMRMLADWFDRYDAARGDPAGGKVQCDLRQWADEADRAQSPPAPSGPSEEVLTRAASLVCAVKGVCREIGRVSGLLPTVDHKMLEVMAEELSNAIKSARVPGGAAPARPWTIRSVPGLSGVVVSRENSFGQETRHLQLISHAEAEAVRDALNRLAGPPRKEG